MARYGRWIGLPELGPPRVVTERDAIDLASPDGDWSGLAVFSYATGPWSVIEELSGGLEADEEKLDRPRQGWLWIHRVP
jgi:hypothetical protein